MQLLLHLQQAAYLCIFVVVAHIVLRIAQLRLVWTVLLVDVIELLRIALRNVDADKVEPTASSITTVYGFYAVDVNCEFIYILFEFCYFLFFCSRFTIGLRIAWIDLPSQIAKELGQLIHLELIQPNSFNPPLLLLLILVDANYDRSASLVHETADRLLQCEQYTHILYREVIVFVFDIIVFSCEQGLSFVEFVTSKNAGNTLKRLSIESNCFS